MIKRFKKIESAGIFNNYSPSTDLPEFNRYNLIYGWNGSGKSTLAKVFRHMENQEKIEHLEELAYQVLVDENEINQRAKPLSVTVKVFNSDFIKSHLRFEKGDAESIIYVGKESVEVSE